MTLRSRFMIMAGLAAASVACLATASRAATQDAATTRTISDIRNVGTAMWHWYKDGNATRRSEKAHKEAQEQSHATSVDFAKIPVISRQELTALLVPKYIAAIPETDGWGHPYELRLNTKDPEAILVMAVRSGGQDGGF
jgi:ABC-type glycerol-3-phosphate transport system substrate-binding protein